MKEKIVTIIDSNSRLTEVNLNAYGKSKLNLGRNASMCEVVIADEIISKCHGTLKMQGERTWYIDNDSTNGTFIGVAEGRKLLDKESGEIELFDKTILRIGDVSQPDKMVLLLYHVSDENEVWSKQVLGDRDINIGRTSNNHIMLKHPGVSRTHCCVKRGERGYTIHDCSSANGVMVNGKNVWQEQVLQDKDVIQLLDYQLFFSNACIYYKSTSTGISLRACNINKYVAAGRKKKQILHDVNCEIKGNEFVAIIGGSGAGKTTLMNAISGFEPDFTGQVFCNGINLIEQFQNLKNIIGFVPQQDIIYENLTLSKMLYYTAKMKMPEDTQQKEIEDRIVQVLGMVGLETHRNTYIRKLSGGQKKRASIAVELLADPKLFFLDEPTSGLDPGTEKSLMKTLKKLAKTENKTIVMVTHTTQNLALCDKVIFMGPGGRLCFCGNVQEAELFYKATEFVDIYQKIEENPAAWEEKYANQKPATSGGETVSDQRADVTKARKQSAIRQFGVLFCRYAELMKNDAQRLLVLLLQPLLIAILLYVVADKKVFDIYESTKSMLFALSCSAIWIGLFNSIQEICKERVIVKREYMANLKLPGYVLSKFVIQAMLGLVQAFILTGVFLKLIGKSREGIFFDAFFPEMVGTVWLTILASIAMGFVISAMAKTGDKAMAIAPFVLIIQLLFSGILFSLKGLGERISYCTVSRWSVESLGSIAKLNRLDLKLQKDYPMLEHTAESFFKASRGHLLETWIVLGCMTAVFIVLSMWLLRGVAKDRR